MAVITEEKTQGLAHCVNSRCKGNKQAPVKAVVRHVALRFTDSGGDMPGIEKSSDHVLFANDKDAACPVCGKPRDLTLQERPTYANLSGHPQDGLLTIKLEDGTIVQPAGESEELDAMRQQIAELSELVAKQSTKAA